MTLVEIHPSQVSNADANDFRQDAIDASSQLRSALSRALAQSGGSAEKSRDIQKRYGVNVTVSWQIYKIANSDDALESCQYVPQPAPMRKLLESMAAQGAPAEAVRNLDVAYAKFETVVDRHAGDRSSFDAMITRLLGVSSDEQVEMTHRRSIYEARRFISGLADETRVFTDILFPSRTVPGEIDSVRILMRVDLRRLSADVPVVIDRRRYRPRPGGTVAEVEPLDHEAFAATGLPIIPRFCNPVSLPLTRKELRNDITATYWAGKQVGRQGSINVTIAEVQRGVPFLKGPNGVPMFVTGNIFATPTVNFIRNFVVHRPTFGSIQCDASRWDEAFEAPPQMYPLEDMGLQRLPCREKMAFKGAGPAAAEIREVPQHVEIMEYVCGKMGLKFEELDLYRLRMEYPVTHTMMVVSLAFPHLSLPGFASFQEAR